MHAGMQIAGTNTSYQHPTRTIRYLITMHSYLAADLNMREQQGKCLEFSADLTAEETKLSAKQQECGLEARCAYTIGGDPAWQTFVWGWGLVKPIFRIMRYGHGPGKFGSS